tara:strand:- start:119 stop:601 length:483 start_codon:yes stop_codon:yes gene_type:complete
MPVLLVGVFDVLPAATAENGDFVKSILQVILAYSAFAFFTNFIREMVKDAEDVEGDKSMGYRTLAVVLGVQQLKYIILILVLMLLVVCGFMTVFLLESDAFSAIYTLIFIDIPLAIFMYLVITASQPLQFKKASQLIKIVMVTGILSMVVFTLSVKFQLQ